MASAVKKIEAAGGGDLRPGERVRAGIFVNPDGLTGSMMATQLGGAVGGAINASRRRESTDEPGGIAARLPSDRCWIGVTDQRVLVWSHGSVRGRPKELVTELPVTDLVGAEATPRATTHLLVLSFADGSTRSYEAPKIGNDPAAFTAAVTRP